MASDDRFAGFLDLDDINYRPIDLVQMTLGGSVLRLSTRGDADAMGHRWEGGLLRLVTGEARQESSSRFRFELANHENEWTAAVRSGGWRGAEIKVWCGAYIGENSESMIADFVHGVYLSGDPSDAALVTELVFDGEISAIPIVDRWLQIEAVRAGAITSYTPQDRIAAEFGFSHRLPRGAVLRVAGETYQVP